jgi:hypothetical protein
MVFSHTTRGENIQHKKTKITRLRRKPVGTIYGDKNSTNMTCIAYFSSIRSIQKNARGNTPSQMDHMHKMQIKAKLRSLAVPFNASDHIEYARYLSFATTDRVAPTFYISDINEEEDEDIVDSDSGDGNAARAAAADEQAFAFWYTHSPIHLNDHLVLSKLTCAEGHY